MSCLEGIIEFAPDGEESECSTVYSEGLARDQLVEEDILRDPEREDDDSADEDPGTIKEEETDASGNDEDDTVTVGNVVYQINAAKRRRDEDGEARPVVAGVEPIDGVNPNQLTELIKARPL